mgnify:CR=1 FL=1
MSVKLLINRFLAVSSEVFREKTEEELMIVHVGSLRIFDLAVKRLGSDLKHVATVSDTCLSGQESFDFEL